MWIYSGFRDLKIKLSWLHQGTYLTSIARSHAKDHDVHEGSVIGVFNGEFWAMFACHQVLACLLYFLNAPSFCLPQNLVCAYSEFFF